MNDEIIVYIISGVFALLLIGFLIWFLVIVNSCDKFIEEFLERKKEEMDKKNGGE